MVLQAIRSLIFYVLYIGQTVIVALLLGGIAMFTGGKRTPASWAIAKYWCASNLVLLRVFGSISTKATGMENIPAGSCIVAAKHQADWDVFAMFPHTGRPAYIVKKELMDIPFFGKGARSLDCIEVDRKNGVQATASMMAEAHAALARGCNIIIFPEGSRKAPLDTPAYKRGIARLYAELNIPVVPVAVNSGLFWGRNSLILWPGLAEAKFLPAIEPGLPQDQFLARLKDDIETASTDLILAAADRGLSRPIDAELRQRLDTARANRAV